MKWFWQRIKASADVDDIEEEVNELTDKELAQVLRSSVKTLQKRGWSVSGPEYHKSNVYIGKYKAEIL